MSEPWGFGSNISNDPPYAGSRWERIAMPAPSRVPDPVVGAEIVKMSDGRQLSGLLEVLDPDSDFSPGWTVEQSTLVLDMLDQIEICQLIPPGFVHPPADMLTSLRVDPAEPCAVIGWGDVLSMAVGLEAFDCFSPPPTIEVDEWDWTGGLSEDQVLSVRNLPQCVVYWPRLTLPHETRVHVTREWERIALRIETALSGAPFDSLTAAEFRKAIAAVRQELRPDEVSRGRLKIAIGVITGLSIKLFSSAVWEALQPLLRDLVGLLS